MADTHELSGQSFENLSEEAETRTMVHKFGIPIYEDILNFKLPRDFYKNISYSFVTNHLILPFKEEDNAVLAAMADPFDLESLEELRIILNREVKPVFTPKDNLLLAIHECYNKEHGAASQLIANLSESKDENASDDDVEVYDLLSDVEHQAPMIKLLNLMVAEAIQQGASDIHFEPHDSGLKVRFRR